MNDSLPAQVFPNTLIKVALLFLLSCSQSVRMALADEPATYDRGADDHSFTIFMKECGWCWYQDPRAIAHNDLLFIGAVKGTGNGEATVGVFDLASRKPLGTAVMNSEFDRDDHNSPVFHARPDGSVLAIYAKHNRDRFHYSRVSNPGEPLKWSAEVKHERLMPNRNDRVTYMNLYGLRTERKLYLFFRGTDFNPTMVCSNDQGDTWDKPIHFFKNEVGGRHRPYARYASNGKDTVYVSITDAHPRDYGNSIYYFEYRNGEYYRADGTLIKNLKENGPLGPSEAELIYQGTGDRGRGFDLSAEGAAWTSSIAIDKNGHPHIAYTVYKSNADHRYRIASWNGVRWTDREVAYGGKCLYDRESSYTGLITLDPVDPRVVVISTDVAPGSGEDLGGLHEIYRATVSERDNRDSIQWQAVTKDSPVRNIRPVIVRDAKRRIIIWNRGDFRTYTNYQLDSVGVIEAVAR